MSNKVYSIEEIQSTIKPIAESYGVERIFLFGSYARGEATATSDMVEEKEGPRLIVCLNDIDVLVRQEKEISRRLAQVQTQANIDALKIIDKK